MKILRSMKNLLLRKLVRLKKAFTIRNFFRLVRYQIAIQSYFFCVWLLVFSRIMMNLCSRLSLRMLSQVKHLFDEDFHSKQFRAAIESEESFKSRCERLLFVESLSACTMRAFFLMWCPSFLPAGYREIFTRCHKKIENPKKWKTESFIAVHRLIIDGKISFKPSILFKCLILLAIHHICPLLPMITGYVIYICFDCNVKLLLLEEFFNPEPKKTNNVQIEKEKLTKEISQRKVEIEKSITKDFSNFFLVWCPTEVIRPDFLASFLGRYDPHISIRDRWMEPSGVSAPAIFGGVIAKFYNLRSAMRAVNALAVQKECNIKTMRAYLLLKFIIEAEASHPLCGGTRTLLIMRAVQGFITEEDMQKAKDMFSEFGVLKSIEFQPRIYPNGKAAVCSAKFAFASQAYAAKLYIDGSHLRMVRHVSVEIKETNYERQIMRIVRRKVIGYLEGNTFSH